MSQPIVPVGQAGIVTMEAIVKRPVVTADDAIAIRSMMNSCLSFDHRVLDGSGALTFLKTLKHELETGRVSHSTERGRACRVHQHAHRTPALEPGRRAPPHRIGPAIKARPAGSKSRSATGRTSRGSSG